MTKRRSVGLLLAVVIACPFAARAISPPPLQNVMVAGDEVCFFESGTDDVRKALHVGDTLTVYRGGTTGRREQVGTVRVLAYIGETYVKVLVLEGAFTRGDVARKGRVACVAVSPDQTCK